MRRAHGLAVAALRAPVDEFVGTRHRFEVLQVGLRVVVENDSGVEEILRVEELLDAAHQPVAWCPHSISTKGAMLRPVPCSALSEPSYFSTTSLHISSMKRA